MTIDKIELKNLLTNAINQEKVDEEEGVSLSSTLDV